MYNNPAYINGLDNEELVALVNAGNNSCLQELFRRFDTILRQKAIKFSPNIDFDDLMQEGLIALFSATKVYNSSLSSFTTFASICIDRAMCSLYRKTLSKKQIPDGSLVYFDDVNELSVGTTPESDFIEKEECAQLAERIKDSLSKTEYIVLLAFLSENSCEKIAQKLNMSIKSVNNAMFRARAKIRTLC